MWKKSQKLFIDKKSCKSMRYWKKNLKNCLLVKNLIIKWDTKKKNKNIYNINNKKILAFIIYLAIFLLCQNNNRFDCWSDYLWYHIEKKNYYKLFRNIFIIGDNKYLNMLNN